MTVRLSGRDLLIVCLASVLCVNSFANALPLPEWGRFQMENALVAVLAAYVGVSAVRAAMLRDSAATEPARPSSRERALKLAVFYLLLVLTPIVAYLIRKP